MDLHLLRIKQAKVHEVERIPVFLRSLTDDLA